MLSDTSRTIGECHPDAHYVPSVIRRDAFPSTLGERPDAHGRVVADGGEARVVRPETEATHCFSITRVMSRDSSCCAGNTWRFQINLRTRCGYWHGRRSARGWQYSALVRWFKVERQNVTTLWHRLGSDVR